MALILFKKTEAEEFDSLEVPDSVLRNCSDTEMLAIEIKEYFYAILEEDGDTTEMVDEKVNNLIFEGGDFWSAVVEPLFAEYGNENNDYDDEDDNDRFFEDEFRDWDCSS